MKKKEPDYILLFTIAVLLIFGTLILFSASAPFSRDRFGSAYYLLNHQLIFGLIPGLILGFLAYKVRLPLLQKWAPLLLLINLALMFAVFIPKIGMESGGAARWIKLGRITLQPSEFLKLTFILYLASWLSSRNSALKLNRQKIFHNQTLVAFFVLIAIITLILGLQSDIGTLGIIALTAILVYFVIGTPLWHTILIILLGSLSIGSLIKFSHYRANRLLVFLNPETDPLGIGYQLKQALIAVGSGGIFGLGLGMSQQKFGFLPQTLADSIFAVFSEETGFIGGFILILLFLLFFWRGFSIGFNSKDKFSQVLAFGITFWLVIQAFINIGSMLGILPLTGVPLPFISYGGSALVAELTGLGILLNISKQVN